MKAGWAVKTLGEVYDVRDGTHDSPKYVESGYPLITSKNLKDKGLSFENVQYISEADYNKINARSAVHRGDVLFAMIGTIGNPTIVEVEPNFAIKNVALLKVPHVQNSSFLKYYLETEEVISKMVSEAKGTTQKFVGLGYLRSFPIKIPSLSEQQRIVAILDQAFEGIAKARANAEQNLQNARALFESHLKSVFTQRGEGWVEKSIGEIAKIKGGKRVPKGYKLLSEPTNHPYLRVTDFNDAGSIDVRDLRYIDNDIFKEIKNYIIHDTDLYISIAGTIGKAGIIPKELDGANLTENACRLVFNSDVLNKYVYYFTTTKDFIEQAGLNTRTAAQPKLALSRLSTIKLGLPNLENQKKLVKEFDLLREETQRLEALYQRKIACLDELKKSLLQQAFAGEL